MGVVPNLSHFVPRRAVHPGLCSVQHSDGHGVGQLMNSLHHRPLSPSQGLRHGPETHFSTRMEEEREGCHVSLITFKSHISATGLSRHTSAFVRYSGKCTGSWCRHQTGLQTSFWNRDGICSPSLDLNQGQALRGGHSMACATAQQQKDGYTSYPTVPPLWSQQVGWRGKRPLRWPSPSGEGTASSPLLSPDPPGSGFWVARENPRDLPG